VVEDLLVLALSLWLLGAFVVTALLRLRYPYELEWLEGAEVLRARELLDGRAIFRAPSAEYIATPYTPFYYVLVALAAKVAGGLSLGAARAVSILATFALIALVASAVKRETGDRRAALLGAGGVAGLYAVAGWIFDLARVDSLFIALVMGSLYVARYARRGVVAVGAAAILLVVAYETKQLALFFLPVALSTLWMRERRWGVGFALAFVSLMAIDQTLEHVATGGWYWVFTQRVSTAHGINGSRLFDFARTMATSVPIAIGASAARAVVVGRGGSAGAFRALAASTWTMASIWGLVTMLFTAVRAGSSANNMLPFLVFLTIEGAVGFHLLARSASRWASRAHLLAVGQMLLLLYDPRPAVPSAADRARADAVVRRLAETDGPVLVPDRPFYAVLAGKTPGYHSDALWNWRMYAGTVPQDLRERLSGAYYARIVTMGRVEERAFWYPAEIQARYRVVEELEPPAENQGDWMAHTRPRTIYEPR
jgi:hypothetical protein